MSKKEKLVNRFLSMPSDFHFDELVRLVHYFGFRKVKSGKTTGSRIKFVNIHYAHINLHKPHPTGILKIYQLKQVKEKLDL